MVNPEITRRSISRLVGRDVRHPLRSSSISRRRTASATRSPPQAVALEHELDLAGDIAFYGPKDFPMITRLLRALAQRAPGFEFNSLRRWLSSPGQYEEVVGDANTGTTEPIGFGER
jgi:hypothetical protein